MTEDIVKNMIVWIIILLYAFATGWMITGVISAWKNGWYYWFGVELTLVIGMLTNMIIRICKFTEL